MVINFCDESQESKPSPRNNLQPNFWRKIHLSQAIYSSAKHHQKNRMSQRKSWTSLYHMKFHRLMYWKNKFVKVVNFRWFVKVFNFDGRLLEQLSTTSLQFLNIHTMLPYGCHSETTERLWNKTNNIYMIFTKGFWMVNHNKYCVCRKLKITPPWKLACPQKRDHPKRKFHLRNTIFQGTC